MNDREEALVDALRKMIYYYKSPDHDKTKHNSCPICIAQAALALPEKSDAPPSEAESEAFRRGIEQGMFTMANAQKLAAVPVAEPSDRERDVRRARTVLADAMKYWETVRSDPEYGGTQVDCIADSFAAEFAAVRVLAQQEMRDMGFQHPDDVAKMVLEAAVRASSATLKRLQTDMNDTNKQGFALPEKSDAPPSEAESTAPSDDSDRDRALRVIARGGTDKIALMNAMYAEFAAVRASQP